MSQYRLTSTPMFYVPGLIEWMLAARKCNVPGARSDAGARKHFITATWPTLPPKAVKAILDRKFTVEGEDVIVTV